LSGWIPTRLTLTGLVEKAGLDALQNLLGESLEIVERFEGEAGLFRHGGSADHIAASIRADVQALDRQGDYRRAIQAGLRNLVAAIHGEEALEVRPEDGLLSLLVALAATDGPCGVPFSVEL
jgi:hypothetical protein